MNSVPIGLQCPLSSHEPNCSGYSKSCENCSTFKELFGLISKREVEEKIEELEESETYALMGEVLDGDGFIRQLLIYFFEKLKNQIAPTKNGKQNLTKVSPVEIRVLKAIELLSAVMQDKAKLPESNNGFDYYGNPDNIITDNLVDNTQTATTETEKYIFDKMRKKLDQPRQT